MEVSNILVWNVQGLNKKSHRDSVRELIASTRPDIVCLQETKIQSLSTRILLSTLGAELDHHVALPAQGTRGGVLIAWKGAVSHEITTRVDTYSTSVLFQIAVGRQWWLTSVYGPQSYSDKLEFMVELRVIRAACLGPWLLAGDFNLIYRAADKNNANLDRAMLGRFRRLLNDLELREIELLGRRFTWSNERSSPTLVKLDRAFCSMSWEDLFPNCILQSTAAGVSEHCPLLLALNSNITGKRHFQFESFWPTLPGFQETVSNAWQAVADQEPPLQRLLLKLNATHRALQSWSQKTVGNVGLKLEQARELLHRLDMAQDGRELTQEEGWLRCQLKQQCLALASLNRTIKRTRSRIDWLAEGDANTKFFHSQARYRKRKNLITKIREGDREFTSQ